MKVILIKDVARLGRKSEVKDVPSGHALNFLIPRKLAVIATPEQLKRYAEGVKQVGLQKEEVHEQFMKSCKILEGKTVQYVADANAQGHLFKGIHVDDILKHLESEEGIILTKKNVLLEHPIKALGTHIIPLSHEGVEGVCTLEVLKK